MDKKPAITVIMPSRNVARYIGQCIESVSDQTFTDLEILAIDADSDDGTWEILSDHARKDERIRLLRTDVRSYGYQVNTGIREAKGRYIGIVETDDMIYPDMYARLFEKAEETGADYVKGAAFNLVDISGALSYIEPMRGAEKSADAGSVINPKEHPELLCKDRFLWLGLYRTSFLRDNEIVLSETKGAAYQDISFQARVLTKAEKGVYIDVPIYKYRLDNASASGYSSRAFEYLAYEHGKVLSEAVSWSAEQKKNWYIKLINQYLHRYHVMAVSGKYWDEAERDMESIREWILKALEDKLITEDDLDAGIRHRLEVLKAGTRETFGSFLMDDLRYMSDVRGWAERIREHNTVIFGCGLNGRYIRCLSERFAPGNVLAFCDNDEDMNGKDVLGVPVVTPDKAAGSYPDALYVIPSSRHENDMRRQLKNAGVDDEQILVYPFGRNTELLTMDVGRVV